MFRSEGHRCTLGIAALLPLLALLLSSVPLRAQITDCRCAKVTLLVQKDVTCKVTFQLTYEKSGIQTEITLAPGEITTVDCEPGLSIAAGRCGAGFVPIPEGGCIINLNALGDPMCCVDACLEQDDAGCWTAYARPTISMAPGCSCRD